MSYYDALETIDAGHGYRIEIHTDDDPMSPREWDNVGILTQLSREYRQPDKSYSREIVEAWNRTRDPETIERYARAYLDAVAVGWWDDPRSSSCVFGYIMRADAEREGMVNPQVCLDGELSVYAAWALGDVYGWIARGPEGDAIESVWGYYGDEGYRDAESTAREFIEHERDGRHRAVVAMFRGMVAS